MEASRKKLHTFHAIHNCVYLHQAAPVLVVLVLHLLRYQHRRQQRKMMKADCELDWILVRMMNRPRRSWMMMIINTMLFWTYLIGRGGAIAADLAG